MLSAWSIAEIVRYGYFTMNLQRSSLETLTWLRYNTFYILYPVGIVSEMTLIWKASEVASQTVQWTFLAILVAYVPGKRIFGCGEARGRMN